MWTHATVSLTHTYRHLPVIPLLLPHCHLLLQVRAWTVQKGSTAPQAAGVIHSDFERGFIKAEIAGWDDFAALQIADGNKPGMDKVKGAGKYRQEGKSYIMQDGDIVLFQFNVSDKGGKKK